MLARKAILSTWSDSRYTRRIGVLIGPINAVGLAIANY